MMHRTFSIHLRLLLLAGIVLTPAALLSAQPAASMQSRREELVARLSHLHPAFKDALSTLAGETPAEAEPSLRQLAGDKDSALSSQAGLLLGRLLLEQNRFEDALNLYLELSKLPQDALLDDGESLFFLGLCQAHTMQFEQARQTLNAYLEKHPAASERLRVAAQVKLKELAAIKPGQLSDVDQRMQYVHRRLTLRDTGASTQEEEKRIVIILDKLIEQAQQQEKDGQGDGDSGQDSSQSDPNAGKSGAPSGNQAPTSPAAQSIAPEGQARDGEKHSVRRSPADDWGKLKDRQRQEIMDSLKTQFPDRYRALIEQYYRQLQEEPES